MSFTASKLLAIAAAEIGYKEKESNSQLDNKTANAGDNNYTKYARDLHAAGYYQANKNGYAWCDMFVDWCFLQLTGSKEKGEYLECQTGLYGAGCEWSSDCYRRAGRFDKNPQPGDQIFFGKTDDEEHTGIVEKVENGKVYTIEGNASNQVKRCTYSLSSSYIVGYGHPRFDPEEATKPVPVVTGRPSTSADEKALWDRCKEMGMNDYGAAGTLANLFAECGLKSNNLQNTGNNKLDMTDEEYTAAVDSGAYTNFVRDSHGYGLCQWTYWSRKQALLDFVKAAGKSVGDWSAQMDFMEKELAGYSGLMKILKTATSVKEASDAFMCQFERPADQSEAAKAKRASYGQGYYDKYSTPAKPSAPETPVVTELKVGDIVEFTGTKHYASANASTGPSCKPGRAKVTAVYKTGKHPYHLIAEKGGGSTVYGWVDVADIKGMTGGAETGGADPAWTPKVGDIVNYNGNTHYISANSTSPKSCKGGKAKITQIYQLGKSKHPYHLVRESGSGATVYGWVDAGSFTKV